MLRVWIIFMVGAFVLPLVCPDSLAGRGSASSSHPFATAASCAEQPESCGCCEACDAACGCCQETPERPLVPSPASTSLSTSLTDTVRLALTGVCVTMDVGGRIVTTTRAGVRAEGGPHGPRASTQAWLCIRTT